MSFFDNLGGLNGNCLSRIIRCFCCNYPCNIPMGNNHCLNKCTFPFFVDVCQVENFLTNFTCGCNNCCKTKPCNSNCCLCDNIKPCFKGKKYKCIKKQSDFDTLLANYDMENKYNLQDKVVKSVNQDGTVSLFRKTSR